MSDAEYRLRGPLWSFLREHFSYDESSIGIDEFPLEYAGVRADAVVANGELHGFEIKSESDTFARLGRQIEGYSGAFDRNWLVTRQKFVTKAESFLPPAWGILVVDFSGDVRPHRRALPQPVFDRRLVASIFMVQELRDFMKRGGAKASVYRCPKWDLVKSVYDYWSEEDVRAELRRSLKARPDTRWLPLKEWPQPGSASVECGEPTLA